MRCVPLPRYRCASVFPGLWCPLPGQRLPLQRRHIHAALLADGLGDALASLPGAGRDKKGTQISIPVPDARLELLATLERTKAVQAVVEVAEPELGLAEELVQVVEGVSSEASAPPEFSGKLLSFLRAADAMIMAVPCPSAATANPVSWLQSAERALALSDLEALEQQVCKGGSSGPDAELDVAKLRKLLTGSKDKDVQRDADRLTRDVLTPGLTSLRARLRAGLPAREARAGLQAPARSQGFEPLHASFEDLARSWLNLLVTWRPLFLLADVPEADAGRDGNSASEQLEEYASAHGLPCLTACVSLEKETVALKDEPEFLQEYLESFGLIDGDRDMAGSTSLRPWRSQSAQIAQRIPGLFNYMTYYTAGEKEARAWMCPRIRRDQSPLPFDLLRVNGSTSAPAASGAGKRTKAEDDGVPAFLASRAIHTSFESRVKQVLIWSYEDLEALGPSDSGPTAKERAKAAGKVRKAKGQDCLQESSVVEFVLS